MFDVSCHEIKLFAVSVVVLLSSSLKYFANIQPVNISDGGNRNIMGEPPSTGPRQTSFFMCIISEAKILNSERRRDSV